MSDFKDSTITYTAVSSPFGGLSDIRSLGVDGPPVMPEDPYAYVVAAFQAPPSPDYVPGPDHPVAASPATESDPDEDPKDDPEEDLADYPADGGDEGDDEDESFDDDEDDDIDIEGDESFDDDKDDDIDIEEDEEEDEYLDLTDSTAVALPAADHAPSAEETEPPQIHIPLPSDTEIARLMAIPTPPPSPLSLLSPPLPLLSPPPIDPTYEEAPLGYRAARLRWRAERGDSRGGPAASEEVMHCLYWFVDVVEQGEGSTPDAMEVGYGIIDTWDDLVGAIQETALTTALQKARVNRIFKDRRYHAHTARLMEGEARASRTAWTQSMDANDDAHSKVTALHTQVSAQRTEITDLRTTDRRFQTTVRTQQEEIRELRAIDRKLHAQFIQALTALKSCQTQLIAALGRI
nr:hypothetical protein [Tanacetum cinerariifolium]